MNDLRDGGGPVRFLPLESRSEESAGRRRRRGPGLVAPRAPQRAAATKADVLWLLTIVSGALNPVQSGLAGALDKALDRPFLVAVVSLALSLLCALVGGLAAGQLGWPPGKAAAAPWWAWLAGLAGFAVFIARPYAATALGAASFTGLTVTASVVFSVLLDHYGLLGFEQHGAGWGRIVGTALMCAGVALVSLT